MYIKEFINLTIAKISPNLYTNSINDTLDKLEKEYNESDYNDTGNIIIEDNDYLRNLNEINNKSNKRKNVNKIKIHRLLDNDQMFRIEESIIPSLSEDISYDLREKNNCSNCSNQNLTQFSRGNIQSNEADLENSNYDKTIYTNINKNGILVSTTEIEQLTMITQSNEDIDVRDTLSNMQIFDESNQISLDDAKNDYESNLTFGLDSLNILSTNQVNLKENFMNLKIRKMLIRYFDKFSFKLYEE